MKKVIKIQYNSPVVLTLAFVSFCVLMLDRATDGWSTVRLFSVYRSSPSDILTYPRFILHVLGHSNFKHYINNFMMILVLGPGLEQRYGSKNLLLAMTLTALVSGMVQWLFFPDSMLLGASGIVFMMIMMSSLAGMKTGCIPLTLILVLLLYIGGEVVDGITLKDNISQLTHIIGGICGAILGVVLK